MALIDGLERYYPLDGDADDVHGGIDAVITGPSPTWDTGHISAQAIDLTASASNKCRASPYAGADFSAQAWFKPTGSSGSFSGLLGNMQTGGVTADWMLFIGGTAVTWYSPGNTAHNTVSGFSVGNWGHIVITRSGTTAKVYVNGSLADTFTVATGGTNDDFLMACRNDGYSNANATMQEVALWNRVLSASEVTELYNAGAGLSYAELGAPLAAGPKLELNGINLGSIMAAANEPEVEQRDIGAVSTAVDGTSRVTRSARKLDLSFMSVPLTTAAAHAWRCFLTGEGEVWSFDANLYGSKGTAASAITNAVQSAGAAKFGAGKLSVGATTGSITFLAAINSWGNSSAWTVGVWRYEGGAWHHYLVRSDGAKWLDGVRDDAATTTWMSVSNGSVTITNTTGSAVLYDDLVVLPFLVPEDWPAQWVAADAAFGLLPFHAATGEWVTEQATRTVMGLVETSSKMKVADGTREKLDVELRAR